MRSAFTILELIFVIILIGIIAAVGAGTFKTNYLLHDTNFIRAKIAEAHYRAIGYERRNFDGTRIANDFRACVDFTLLDENASDGSGKYRLHVTVDSSDFQNDMLCFDAKGAPYEGDYAQKIVAQKMLKVQYRTDERIIAIEPQTGYAIIK